MKYTSLIFDFDGTLFDTRHAIAATLLKTFHERALAAPAEEAIWATIQRGITLERTFEALLPEDQLDVVDEWVSLYREIYNGGLGVAESRPFSGIPSLVRRLANRPEPIVVCSNKGRLAVENTLAHFQMTSVAALIVAAEGAAPTKPDPSSFLNRIRPAIGDAASSRSLVIGDTDADIMYARAIGADVCWAAYGYGDAGRCEALKPDYIVRAPGELHALLCLPES